MYLRQAKPAGCSRWKPPADMRDLHSLKLTKHQKTGRWETILFFWETPFSGTFVVSFRESTFFGCQRSLCLRAISGCGKFGGFLNWLQVGGLCQERLFFYGQTLSPPPPKPNSSLEMQKNFERSSCQVIQSKWPFWGMVNFRDPFGNGWKRDLQRKRGWSLVTSTDLVIIVVWIFLKLWFAPSKIAQDSRHFHPPGSCPYHTYGTKQCDLGTTHCNG